MAATPCPRCPGPGLLSPPSYNLPRSAATNQTKQLMLSYKAEAGGAGPSLSITAEHMPVHVEEQVTRGGGLVGFPSRARSRSPRPVTPAARDRAIAHPLIHSPHPPVAPACRRTGS